MDATGQDPGHPGWDALLDEVVAAYGSLTAVAEHLSALRGHTEDIESIARGLRRLRGRGHQPGGKWGDRLLRAFGLPKPILDRLRFMGSYHSRFVDLPVPLCLDLVQLWDRPPVSDSGVGRLWLSLARASIALRGRRFEEAGLHLDAAGRGDPVGAVERVLGLAVLEARGSDEVPPLLEHVPALLEAVSGSDEQCLRARYIGQLTHAWNRQGHVQRSERALLELPEGADVHPFARARRANGLAYARWRQGDVAAAVRHARDSARYAGDAGHVRLRAMALLMLARVAQGTDEGTDALARASQIAEALDDDVLRVRCHRSAGR